MYLFLIGRYLFLLLGARDCLRRLREDHMRDSELVVRLWEESLMNYREKLGDECNYCLPTILSVVTMSIGVLVQVQLNFVLTRKFISFYL